MVRFWGSSPSRTDQSTIAPSYRLKDVSGEVVSVQNLRSGPPWLGVARLLGNGLWEATSTVVRDSDVPKKIGEFNTRAEAVRAVCEAVRL